MAMTSAAVYASATANNAHVTQQQQQQTTNQQRQQQRLSRARTKSAAHMTSTYTLLLKRANSAPQWIFLFILIYLATGECLCACT